MLFSELFTSQETFLFSVNILAGSHSLLQQNFTVLSYDMTMKFSPLKKAVRFSQNILRNKFLER